MGNRNELYLIENKIAPWGDWGDILWSGLTPWNKKINRICIERTGPFTPRAYFSNDNFIIISEIKDLIEKSPLKGIEFLYKLKKKKIVNLEWNHWDKKREITNYLDEIYEPEDIINNGIDDINLKINMPDFYLAYIPNKVHLTINKFTSMEDPSEYITFHDNRLNHSDFFTGVERLGCFITFEAKSWFELNCPDCFNYYLIKSK